MNIKERNDIMLKNQGLIYKIAKEYVTNSLQLEDLVSEGQFGLARALKSFDESKGFNLSTYATYWIKYYISKAIINTDRTVRIPNHVYKNKNIKVNAKEYKDSIEEYNFADTRSIKTPEEVASINTTKILIENKLNLLNSRSKTIIVLRYGLLNHRVHSIKEISDKINLSSERTRQLHLEALNKLKGTLNELDGSL